MARDPLAKSLSDLVKAIERAEPARPAPLTLRSVPLRDDEGRLIFTLIERSDGKKFKRTPIRDEDHRIVESVTEEIPEGEN